MKQVLITAAVAGLAVALASGCDVSVKPTAEESASQPTTPATSEQTTQPTSPPPSSAEPSQPAGSGAYPGPCPAGSWRLTGLDSRRTVAGVDATFSGGGSMTLKLANGTWNLSDNGSKPVTVSASGVSGTATIKGTASGTYRKTGSTYVFDDNRTTGTVHYEAPGFDETEGMDDVTGALAPTGVVTATCKGTVLTLKSDTFTMTWTYTGAKTGGPAGGTKVVNAGGTHACGGGTVRIEGSGNPVVLTGRCARVEVTAATSSIRIAGVGTLVVSGSGNNIRATQADRIEVTGLGNRVRWQNTSADPVVTNTGSGNVISRA